MQQQQQPSQETLHAAQLLVDAVSVWSPEWTVCVELVRLSWQLPHTLCFNLTSQPTSSPHHLPLHTTLSTVCACASSRLWLPGGECLTGGITGGERIKCAAVAPDDSTVCRQLLPARLGCQCPAVAVTTLDVRLSHNTGRVHTRHQRGSSRPPGAPAQGQSSCHCR